MRRSESNPCSLVPLEFRAIPWDDITDLFTAAVGAALGGVDRRPPGRAQRWLYTLFLHQHFAAQPVIWLRYAVLHVLVIVVLAFIQWPHFQARRQPNPIAHPVAHESD